ncbi:Multidrug efflux pump subunit AcrB [Rubritalea squalenifaciens DSM 18772]|uniref:Multidrug efflux pump subunit AcrB n=1 Tax=Rubritalea squalenifaciens DSM 18772 TaxID=1123071 RepID=A0A1M6H941_9BACT|nr:efflux RND transporter permease subunit [Rubritalea squalenifaciens]SHJ18675.1 Multidrug efflux pump subunit AcrB [Rubritalea squalenifaciens DSM 18772]
MEKAIRWFSRNHVAANFLMLLVMVAGIWTWFQLRKEVFPETSLDAVTVNVPFPNATPEEVEDGILLLIEDVIADINGVKRYTSTATEGMGAVTIEVETGYDVREVMDDVKSKVDGITNFPEEAEEPVIEEALISYQVMSVAVSADTDEKTLRKMAETVRDGLLNYSAPEPETFMEKMDRMMRGEPKITKASLANVRPYEISIEISDDTLRRHGLSLAGVATALRQASIDLPGGTVQEKSGEILVRTKGKIRDAEDFANVTIVSGDSGEELKLGDIAKIYDGFEDVSLRARFDGRRAALVNVFRTGEQDTMLLAKAVQDYIENVAPNELPPGVNLELWNDQSKMLQGRLALLGRNGTWGLVLVFIVLALFLRPSLAALVAIGIPVSFAGGVWMMPYFGVSVNMISLFAFILVLGIVVDDAIVVGENVYSRIRAGEHPRHASWKGTHEVGVVVTFGVLTTMAAFTPMLGLSGVSGKIWPNIPLVVIPVLMFSLVQSKLVLPAHLATLRPRQEGVKHGPVTRLQHWVADGLEWFIEHLYKPALRRCLQFRYVVWAVFFALLLATLGLVASKRIPFIFMPKVEGDVITAKLVMPVGVPFGVTDEAIQRMESAAIQVGEEMKGRDGQSVIKHYLASTGTQPFRSGFNPGSNQVSSYLGEVTLELIPAADRDYSADQIITSWREKIGQIPGVVELTFRQETNAGGNAIDIEITGKDLEELKQASDYITDNLAEMNGVTDITTNWRMGKWEVVYNRDALTEAGKSLGFTVQSVSSQLRSVFYGDEVQRIQRGRDEVKVMVRYPENERKSLETLEEVRLNAMNGAEVPIKQVIASEPNRGLSTINRVDGRRSISISADVDKTTGANPNEVVATFNKETLAEMEKLYPGVRWGYRGEQKDQKDSVSEMGVKFIFALIMIYVLMAIPLRSYIQPAIVMSVIPFGIVGAVWGHMLLGMDLSIMSLCGVVALSGVVVNDSLVLVEYVNRHRNDEGSLLEAVNNAGARRFRPILLTSLTTFAGLMPMLLETDMQARFLVPMAVSLGFGILFATTITLLLVPSVYVMLEDVKKVFCKIFGIEYHETRSTVD